MLDWFDTQRDQSASVRMLIHDEIRQHGLVDRVAREKFGAPLVQTLPAATAPVARPAAGQPSAAPAAPSATAAAAPPASSPAAPVQQPVLSGLTSPDPRDAEIAQLRASLSDAHAALGHFSPFLDEMAHHPDFTL